MQLLNSAGLLAVLTFGSVVSSLPSGTTAVTTVFDPSVTFEEHIKQFKGSFEAPSSSDKDSLAPLAPSKLALAGGLQKRWTSTTCGPEFHLLERFGEALSLIDSTILALEFPDDTQRRRYIRYFGEGYWNPTVRGIIRDRYLRIKNRFFDSNVEMICLRNEVNNNAYATTTYFPGRQDLGAVIRLYKLFWEAPDPNQCGDNGSKRSILVHEGAHAAFDAADHGNDPALDAYLYGWYAASVYGNCPF